MLLTRPLQYGALVLCTTSMWLSSTVMAEWPVPDELQQKVETLDEAQLAFITSGEALNYLPERQLTHELASREPESLAQLLNDLMALAQQMGYNPERDMGAMPLNLASRRYNMPRVTPKEFRKFEREPGPFSVHRYLAPQSGVPTFGGAPVAIYPEDLVAGDVDVAIIGVRANFSSGRRDAAWAPNEMRADLTIAQPDAQSLVDPMQALSVVDYGNFARDMLSAERTAEHVAMMVAETAQTGAVPFIVGGDSSLMYPAVSGVAQVSGERSFGLLHLSAHPDVQRDHAHTLSDTQALFRLLDEGVIAGEDTVQLGLRGAGVDADSLRWLRQQQVRYHTMTEVQEKGAERTLKKVLNEIRRGPDRFFVSIDVSVIDPSELVAAGRLVPGGLGFEPVRQAVREVCASKEIVGFEITDMVPNQDSSRLSVVNSNALLNACLVGMALRRSGLAADYVHPLVVTHGQR